MMEAPAGIPAMPSWLGDRAQTYWKAIAPRLLEAGHLCLIDEGMLAVFVTSYETYQDLRDDLLRYPVPTPATSLEIEQHRLLRDSAEDARLRARRWAAEFLIIPHERVHLAQLTDEGDDAELAPWFATAAGDATNTRTD